MTSPRKLAANRQNALRSTGPRSAEGKARSAQNPLVHGLLAREALLPTEARRAFERFARAFREDWKPVGVREHYLVERMIIHAWRLGRVVRMEADILSWKRKQDPIDQIHIYEADYFANAVNHFYIPDNHRGPKQEPADARDKDSAPAEETPLPIGLAFLQGCGSGTDAFTRLSRHEAAIERSFYRAFHTLQRLQHARLGGYVPRPPLAVDLTVSAGAEGEPDNAIADPGGLEPGAGELTCP